jgi:hypothetical protein
MTMMEALEVLAPLTIESKDFKLNMLVEIPPCINPVQPWILGHSGSEQITSQPTITQKSPIRSIETELPRHLRLFSEMAFSLPSYTDI